MEFGWRLLVRVAAIVAAVVFAVTAAALTDVEAGLFAVGLLISFALLRLRRGTLGLVFLGLLFSDTIVWMVPGSLSNLRHGGGLASTAVPAILGIVSIVGVIAAIGALIGRGDRLAKLVAVGAPVVLVLGLAVGGRTSASSAPQTGSIAMDTKDVRFSPDEITGAAGRIEISLSNKDLFWHTFTIHALDVNVKIPSIGTRNTVFRARAGTYKFVCAIPGHEQAGMKGTLIVR
jgi:plastocyanin